MRQYNDTYAHTAEPILIELGEVLLSRFLEIEQYWDTQTKPAKERARIHQQVESLISSFLDRSSNSCVTLTGFQQDEEQTYRIEFNASVKNALSIEYTLTTLFATEPQPFAIERYVGEANECFLLRKVARTPCEPVKPGLGLSPKAP